MNDEVSLDFRARENERQVRENERQVLLKVKLRARTSVSQGLGTLATSERSRNSPRRARSPQWDSTSKAVVKSFDSKPLWAMSKYFDISKLVKTPSKSLSKLEKLGHTRRYGAHFEDLDEAHPSRMLQEAVSLHLVSNIEKTAFCRVQTLSKCLLPSNKCRFHFTKAPGPSFTMLALTSWSKTFQPSKQMHFTLN
jgi:hypothetical protein